MFLVIFEITFSSNFSSNEKSIFAPQHDYINVNKKNAGTEFNEYSKTRL